MSPTVACAGGVTPSPKPSPTPTQRTIPAITLTDLVSFRPAPPRLASEPDGIGVAGLPLNLVATTSMQRLTGTLFDFPVTVRFAPHHYDWHYGDGATQTTAGGGATWAATGDPQFTPTPTSHTYTQRGTYTASVTVFYAPDVNFGDGIWRPVAGYVTATSTTQSIRILEARTALVAHTCVEDPAGPGC
ncbi:hypothetical protein [Microbacterium kribbense]|uniref:hypothetical protein n=1 Tax=Microbacterium kribbense TaxID=433645 RepID=UPI0031DCF644